MQASRAAVCCLKANVARPHDHSHDCAQANKRRVFLPAIRPCMRGQPRLYPHGHSVCGFFFSFGGSLLHLCSQSTVGVIVNRWLSLNVVLVHDDALFTAKVQLSRAFRIWTTIGSCCVCFSSSINTRLACGLPTHITLTVTFYPDPPFTSQRTFPP